MQKISIALAFITVSVLMVNCAPKASKVISALPVESKEQIVAQYTPDQLEAGKAIFLSSCDKCHKLKQPETRTPEKWNRVLKRMIPKAKLSDEDGKLVRAYLIAHSKEG